ncbi:hypothetical protein Poli38472_008873 [Pythium oligandrum]|uniref:Protein kinase domain-containing protein n=1 Tax=Pythium oligandrum TaxID=41045 RepID=A0A8K1C4G5_PYTOL|nr:hypothetical protein Poli38472_008873 [Pythium oligandrum]|eukprot:TMW56225.1 hypothetical protein Poli38472_008873 [Pythium oligandrum]
MKHTSSPSPKDSQAAALAVLKRDFRTLQIILVTGYSIMCFLSLVLIAYLRWHRREAHKGTEQAARKVILPAFEPLLVVLAFVTGSFVVFVSVALGIDLYVYSVPRITTEVFYSGRQFVFLSIIVFMLQQSVSGPALRRSVVITFLLSTYTLPITWCMIQYGDPNHFYAVITVARVFMLLFYSYVFIWPPCRASKRTIREYCVYACIYYGFLFAYNDYFRQNKLDTGFYITYTDILWGSLCPLVIWRVLRADTEHWRGMGQRAVALQMVFRQKKNLPERVSSKGLHVLIEMHRKYVIDFAYLELKQRIGIGASAVVFNGILRSKIPVAVKVYTPSDFTDETVAAFSQEAALCGALHHPNIVKFHGMCVSPPTICLVSELCQGSLEDITCVMARRAHTPNREQLLINIMYMLDAARAVAYIHSFTPAFLHRDIKPANFLVDVDNTVKLTDFGESRSLPRSNIARNRQPKGLRRGVSGGSEAFSTTGEVRAVHQDSVSTGSVASLRQARSYERLDPNATRLTIKGTVDYMAPEIINGKGGQAAYGEAADVYALAITMWDILYPMNEKYPDAHGNQWQIFQSVTAGERPQFGLDVHPNIRKMIENMWHPDPRMRLSAHSVVDILESIQEEVAIRLASRLAPSLEQHKQRTKYNHAPGTSFMGEFAVDVMEIDFFVDNPGEGVRMGNALMDAGVLHHIKHSLPFECSNELYYLDEINATVNRPLGGSTEFTQSGSEIYTIGPGSPVTRSDRGSLPRSSLCACRKHSRRQDLPKQSRMRRLQRQRARSRPYARENLLGSSLALQARLLGSDIYQDNADLSCCNEWDEVWGTEDDRRILPTPTPTEGRLRDTIEIGIRC